MILLFFLIPTFVTIRAEGEVEVQLKLGTIRGKSESYLDKTVHSFLGVPFAEKPLGENRFRPPRVKKSWNETLDTRKLSPACYQGRDPYEKENKPFWGAEMWNANTPISEDCLYMNIWAPAQAFNLTVMVWLFGGGFWYGSPSLALYDGRALAIQGNVVVVNVNYRVGAFGFLYYDHEDVPGNMGLLDQQLALYWIKDHIFNLGGDPSRIVLFGESAGASSIVAHMIAPSSRHLFTNGILQSGALDNRWAMDSPSHALSKSIDLASRLNCTIDGQSGLPFTMDQTVSCMRDLPAQKLVDELWNFNVNFLEFPFVIVSRDRNFFKHKDGFKALREGDFRDDVNIMIGINHDEGNFWNIYNLAGYFDKEVQPELNRTAFHDCIETAFKVQPTLVRNAAKFVNQMVGDYFFTCDSLWMADMLSEKRNGKSKSGKVFIYHFAQTTSANPWPEWTGVMHGYEIEFVFGAPLANPSSYKKEKVDREQKFSKKVMHAQKRVECDLWRHAKDIEYAAYDKSLVVSSTSLNSIISSFILLSVILF
ncbi:ace-3 [Pristionchus pacificus]|uniref:Acetylcholinesterase n=1 Tax=Pristionchus pacificus TaxID=54126 RepID=A0A2A6CIV3_PRIPA|nr:ace-3 [Pristionchus pacificus]|eukprot:PDM78132.1 ace-3 [Pristionchus pacificus]